MTSNAGNPPASPEPGSARGTELERLQAENAALKAEMARLASPSRQTRLRSIAVGVLIAVIAVSFTGASIGLWARRSLVNQDVFVDRVAPLANDPAVQAALTVQITDQLMELVDPQALFEEALPERGQILAAPLSAAVRSFVSDQVANVVASDRFAAAWERVVSDGHAALIRILEGDSELVSASDEAITINLVPIINQALAQLGEVSPEIFGRTIDIPALTADDVPEAARERIAEAFGREPSPNFGVIEIEGRGDGLASAQEGLKIFNTLVWVLVLLTVLLIPLTLWLSHRRRRTLLQLTFVLAVATVLVRRLVLGLQSEALDQVRVDVNRGAVEALTNNFVDPLLRTSEILLWILAAVALAALITGPYPWARSFRDLVRRLVAGGVAMAGSVGTAARDERTVGWIRTHRGTLQVAGVVATFFVLLLFDLSWGGVFVLLLLLGAYLLGISLVTDPPLLDGEDQLESPPDATEHAPTPPSPSRAS
jgi:hypothetical protein